MGKIISILKNVNLLFLLLVFILSIPTLLPLFKPGYFSLHDYIHIMIQFDMQRCIQDFQLPCRWSPDLGGGYGNPFFNFHPSLPYYFGVLIRFAHLSIISSVKALFLIGLVGSAFSMYFLSKEFFGKVIGLVCAVAFIYAPYRAVQTYVRGSLNESWALIFAPVVFLAIYKFIQNKRWYWFVLSILSISGLVLSHNVMILIFILPIFIWSVYWLMINKEFKLWWKLGLIFVWSVLLSSFYLLPSYFEIGLVNVSSLTTGYYQFNDHFVTLNQLFFNRHSGYGPSTAGDWDDLSFQIGWPMAFISLFAIVVLSIQCIKNKKRSTNFWLGLFFILLFLYGISMSVDLSKPIWNGFEMLKYVQFPWRFLSLIIFATSFLVGWVIYQIKGFKLKFFLSVIIIVLTIGLNANYFHPQIYYPNMTDQESLVNLRNWRLQSLATLPDYVPVTAELAPTEIAPFYPWTESKQAKIENFDRKTNRWKVTVVNNSKTSEVVFMPVFDFPNWEVSIDGKKINHLHNHPLAIISYAVPPGKHNISGKLSDTPIRKFANVVSLISFVILILFVMQSVLRKKK